LDPTTLWHDGADRALSTEEQKEMKTDFKSVDDYIASQPDGAQTLLHRVRRTIRKAVPQAEETISYKMPTYRLHGKRMLFFAGWKRHYSLYPATKHIIATLSRSLRRTRSARVRYGFRSSSPSP
jgi:uncharacterized protein YdhG (YjbR/CyaY superfamily)